MNERDRTSSRRRRLLIAGALGLLLAFVAVWFISNVYDPFADEVEDLVTLLPDDLDFVVESRDFPTFVKALEDRTFYRQLEANREFGRFLDDPIVRDTGIVPLLREALASIHGADQELDLPFDLEILGDLSGRQVVIGGSLPPAAGAAAAEPVRFIAAIQPESAWGIVGVNALLDETLCDLFVADRLQGVAIQHRQWGVELTRESRGRSETYGVARVARAILIGNDVELVARTARRIDVEGVPLARALGPERSWVWSGAADASIDVSVRRSALMSRFDPIERILVPTWGPDGARAFERFFPAPAGEWIRIGIEMDAMARLRIETEVAPRAGGDVFSDATAIDRGAALRELDQVLEQLPHDVFGYARLGIAPGDLVAWMLADSGLIDVDKKLLWYEELARLVPRFQRAFPPNQPPDLGPDIGRAVDACLDDGVGVALFRKQRTDGLPNAAPGFAVIARIRDRAALNALLEEIDGALRGQDITAFETVEEAGVSVWSIVNTTFLDSPDDNRPGFAILPDHVVITNWAAMLRDMLAVRRGELAGFGAGDLLRFNLDLLEHHPRAFLHVDFDGLYAYMDDAVEGWVRDRSEISDQQIYDRRRELEIEATRVPVPPSERDVWIDRRMALWKAEQAQARSPALIRRDIERRLAWFRHAFSFFFASAGLRDDVLRLEARLDASRR